MTAIEDFQSLFFDSTQSSGRDVYGLSQVTSSKPHKLTPPPPDADNLMLTQAFTKSAINNSQFFETKVDEITAAKKPFVLNPKNRNSKVGVVAPSAVAKRPRKPLFKAPVRERKGSVDFISQISDYSQHSSAEKHMANTENIQEINGGNDFTSNDFFNSQYPDVTDTPQVITLNHTTSHGAKEKLNLRPVTELPASYRRVFDFPYFNSVQSRVFDDVFYGDRSLAVCAPTGSGKTVVFELAIIRLLIQQGNKQPATFKIIYMAPVKALCSERYDDWKRRFGPLGLQCQELTGDTELDDYSLLQNVHIIFTTPEKWDSMTRRWRDNRSLVQMVRVFLIDEIHMLNDSTRGATMEAVVSRMKTVQACLSQGQNQGAPTMRMIAVSATVPNVEDVADWLSTDISPATHLKMDESCRPVRLRKVVLGYACSESLTAFKFDLSLNYRLPSVINTYAEQKPALVFCATRKGCMQTATILIKEARFVMGPDHKQRLTRQANSIKDAKLRDTVLSGVGYHHAGLEQQDRHIIEDLFSQGELPVLMATSTLAMGVNLPAHLVVVKSTEHYVAGVYADYTETQILQMIGRAGRPQFDTTATAVIMTKNSTKRKYESLLDGTQVVESSLHKHLTEHLNAEIVLRTITNVTVALDWIKSTFLYKRIIKNPEHYGLKIGLTTDKVEEKLQELCLKDLNSLASVQLLQMDEDCFDLTPTDTGKLMAQYCVAFDTMKNFHELLGSESTPDLLAILCRSQEFHDVQLRVNEKKTLNTLNKDRNKITIRFPMQGKIKSNDMKVNCLIQTQLGCLTLADFALQQDTTKIFRTTVRIARCLMEVLWQRQYFHALMNAVRLFKCLRARLWENSKYVSRQLPGIGLTLSTALVNAGVANFQKIEETNPRELELIVNRHPPFGNQLRDAVMKLPKYKLNVQQSGNPAEKLAKLDVVLELTNADLVTEQKPREAANCSVLLIGDMDNSLVFKARIMDSVLIQHPWTRRLEVKRCAKGDQLNICLINQNWVGLDIHNTLTPVYKGRPPPRLQQQVRPAAPVWPPVSTPDQHMDTGEIDEDPWGPDRQACSHRCINKATCAHRCCKEGVRVRAHTTHSRAMSTYQQGLKHKLQCTSLPTTPHAKVPRDPDDGGSLQQFVYNSGNKPRLTIQPTTADPMATPRTPSGWENLDVYQQRIEATEQWVNQDDDNWSCHGDDENPLPAQRRTAKTEAEGNFNISMDWDDDDDVIQIDNNDTYQTAHMYEPHRAEEARLPSQRGLQRQNFEQRAPYVSRPGSMQQALHTAGSGYNTYTGQQTHSNYNSTQFPLAMAQQQSMNSSTGWDETSRRNDSITRHQSSGQQHHDETVAHGFWSDDDLPAIIPPPRLSRVPRRSQQEPSPRNKAPLRFHQAPVSNCNSQEYGNKQTPKESPHSDTARLTQKSPVGNKQKPLQSPSNNTSQFPPLQFWSSDFEPEENEDQEVPGTLNVRTSDRYQVFNSTQHYNKNISVSKTHANIGTDSFDTRIVQPGKENTPFGSIMKKVNHKNQPVFHKSAVLNNQHVNENNNHFKLYDPQIDQKNDCTESISSKDISTDQGHIKNSANCAPQQQNAFTFRKSMSSQPASGAMDRMSGGVGPTMTQGRLSTSVKLGNTAPQVTVPDSADVTIDMAQIASRAFSTLTGRATNTSMGRALTTRQPGLIQTKHEHPAPVSATQKSTPSRFGLSTGFHPASHMLTKPTDVKVKVKNTREREETCFPESSIVEKFNFEDFEFDLENTTMQFGSPGACVNSNREKVEKSRPLSSTNYADVSEQTAYKAKDSQFSVKMMHRLCDQNIGFSDKTADTNTFSLLDMQQQKDSVSGHHLNEKYQEKTYSLRNEIKVSDSSLFSQSVVQDGKEIPDVTPVSRKSFFFTDNSVTDQDGRTNEQTDGIDVDVFSGLF